MPHLTAINQPFGGQPNRVGDHLAALLSRDSKKSDSAYIAVAFAKASGVGILFEYFQDFVAGGSTLEIAVGIDQMGTSRQGLELVLQTGASAYIFHNSRSTRSWLDVPVDVDVPSHQVTTHHSNRGLGGRGTAPDDMGHDGTALRARDFETAALPN